uniref:ABC transporter permease n=1 Tax=Ndongobacter massiliensis TaxID=1871025 RepID=UPI000931390B|nr:ABC transporter permease [Ndongobacter massiliensis]
MSEKKTARDKAPFFNGRRRLWIAVSITGLALVCLFLWGHFMTPDAYAIRYEDKFLPPSSDHWFGTDYMGRDMFFRSIKGLATSLQVGLAAAGISSVLGLLLGISSAVLGGVFDQAVLLAVDLCMGLPHLVLLILISVLMGRGERGVLFAVAFTHWPELTRLVRSEVLQIRNAPYVQAAYRMGRSRFQVACSHLLPHVFPVYVVGLVLLFPHAIMHESAITFLGFGLPAQTPAVGVILAEAMKHIATGKWWLALFPGLLLILVVLLFYRMGELLKRRFNPTQAQE